MFGLARLVCVALMLWATSAGGEVIVPFIPGNQLTPEVSATCTQDPVSKTWEYRYSVKNLPSSLQRAWLFAMRLRGDVADIVSPQGWSFVQHSFRPVFHWACTEAEPLAPGAVDDGNVPPCRYAIAPGSTLSGFRFRSIHPPGDVPFWIQGEKKWPQTTGDSPGGGTNLFHDSISGVTTGPVPVQTCSSGASTGAACDDGSFCNGADTCRNGSCSQHAGNPCPGADGDGNCSESCDEENNDCTLPDPPGSVCPGDGNPCTVDECDGLGACVHPPGHAGVVCRASQGIGEKPQTCTGTSEVCPADSR